MSNFDSELGPSIINPSFLWKLVSLAHCICENLLQYNSSSFAKSRDKSIGITPSYRRRSRGRDGGGSISPREEEKRLKERALLSHPTTDTTEDDRQQQRWWCRRRQLLYTHCHLPSRHFNCFLKLFSFIHCLHFYFLQQELPRPLPVGKGGGGGVVLCVMFSW